MENLFVEYKPYTGGAGPTKNQELQNDIYMALLLISKGYDVDILSSPDDEDLRTVEVKIQNSYTYILYDRYGYCIDGDSTLGIDGDQVGVEEIIKKLESAKDQLNPKPKPEMEEVLVITCSDNTQAILVQQVLESGNKGEYEEIVMEERESNTLYQPVNTLLNDGDPLYSTGDELIDYIINCLEDMAMVYEFKDMPNVVIIERKINQVITTDFALSEQKVIMTTVVNKMLEVNPERSYNHPENDWVVENFMDAVMEVDPNIPLEHAQKFWKEWNDGRDQFEKIPAVKEKEEKVDDYPGVLPRGTLFIFRLKGMEEDFNQVEEPHTKKLDGTMGMVLGLDTYSKKGEQDGECYNVLFSNGREMAGLSGYHIEKLHQVKKGLIKVSD